MRFVIQRTSDGGGLSGEPPAPGAVRAESGKWHIEITDLDALVQLIDLIGEPLILSRRHGITGATSIEIYDDLREEFQ